MARIQILPLPTLKADGYEHTPFILILDQVDTRTEHWPDAFIENLREQTGAATVLAHEATLDAPGALELTEEQREQLLDYLLEPPRITLGDPASTATAPRTLTPATAPLTPHPAT